MPSRLPFPFLKSPSYFRLVATCVLLALCLLGSDLSAKPLPPHPVQVSVDISSLVSFLDTLSADEKEEQVRDWAAYGLQNELGAPAAEEAPFRHPALKDTSPGEVSKGRIFPLSDKEWAVLLPKGLGGDKALIGGLVDKKYAKTNALPEKISLFTYERPAKSSSIEITFVKTFACSDIFTAGYGYATATVSSLPELRKFLGEADDIVMVQWRPGALTLGGRSYGHDPRRCVTVEEIAAVYQAYNIPADPKAYDAFIAKRYAELLGAQGASAHPPAAGSAEERELLAKTRQRFPHPKHAQGDAKIGFSLDLDLDYDAFADDVEEFARTSPLLQEPDFNGSSASELVTVAERIRSSRNQTPLIVLLRRLAASGTKTDMRVYSALYSIQQYRSFQTARYDGNLQGTKAGMTLFYTDLLAKMWAMDYEGSAASVDVKGFRPMTQIAIPKLYWVGYGNAANTRLWFGLKQEGFDVYGDKALFQPIATRVYAASSDLLTPGREEHEPNYQSKEFLGWWDRHYDAFADYEPGYNRLNQIQKWSCIFLMLQVKERHDLDFLLGVPVKRDLDFAAWSKAQDQLKTRIDIAFLDKRKVGHETECLPLLHSKPHPFLGGYGMISGGITLATQADIQAKLQKNAPAAVAAPGANPNGEKASPIFPFANVRHRWPTPAAASDAQPQQQPLAPAVGKGKVIVESAAEPKRTDAASEPKGAEGRSDGGGKKRATIRLGWEKSPSLEAVNLVTALAASQQPNAPAGQGEAIFEGISAIQSVVRIKQWDTYLVKLSTVKDGWLYLRINPPDVAGYPAKAAGSFAAADIFCARLMSAAEAEQLAQGKTVVK